MALVFLEAIKNLQNLMQKLQTAEDALINYLEGISQPTGATPTSLGEEDILIALQELQKSPTDYVAQVLTKFAAQGTVTENDVLVALNLVQTYLDTTNILDGILTTLNEIDDSPSKTSPPPTNQNLYFAVADARNALAKALVLIQTEPGLAEGEVDIDSLLRESQTILDSLTPFLDNSFIEINRFNSIVSQFVNHLKRAQLIFNTLGSKDVQLTALEIQVIRQLIQNWETITGNLKIITDKEGSVELEPGRKSIAQSIQIHNLLETIYDDLAEILRSNDLFNPAIL